MLLLHICMQTDDNDCPLNELYDINLLYLLRIYLLIIHFFLESFLFVRNTCIHIYSAVTSN